MINETVTIVLPLPPKVLSPNHHIASKGGRFAKMAATKKYREQAKDATLAACIETAPWKLASVTATFFFKDKRRRDQDNALAMLKAAYDGIVDSGLIVDDDYDHLKRETPEFEIDAKYPRVELTVCRKE